jgi:phage portal protein BeeE
MKQKRKNRKKTKKAVQMNVAPEERHIAPMIKVDEKQNRGAQVYSLSSIMALSGYNKQGKQTAITTDNPYFVLCPEERNSIFQLSSPVFGIVSSRMNRISGLNFEINKNMDEVDEQCETFKNTYDIIIELSDSEEIEEKTTSEVLRLFLVEKIPTLRKDLSNFDKALLRWKKQKQKEAKEQSEALKQWLMHPNPSETWTDFVKIWVYDLLIHGTDAIYKDVVDGMLNNIQHLAGGSTIPVRTPFVDSQEAYIQSIDYNYQVFYEDEIVFSQYMPVSWRSYGMIPLESLINKVAESLFFDKLMSEQADGTKPPEKAVLITNDMNFGSDITLDVPIEAAEQKRIEEKFNQPIKNGIMTFAGNNVSVVDISKENTMEFQNKRQKDIREEVALVFNTSNIEANLTGSENTSGRSTSEVQQEIEQGKGITPILRTIEQKINDEILPYRAGPNFTFKFIIETSEEEQVDLLTKKVQSNLWSVNELRIEDLNRRPFDDDKYNNPIGQQPENNEQNITEEV